MAENRRGTSSDSLHDLYTLFIEQFHGQDSPTILTGVSWWIVGIAAVILIVATLFVYMIQGNYRKQIADAGDSKQKQEYYGIDDEVLAYAPEHATEDKTGAVVMAGFIMAAVTIATVFICGMQYAWNQIDDSGKKAKIAAIAEQIQDTATTHILEDYTVTAVRILEEPHESESNFYHRQHKEEMARWAEDFYHSTAQTMTVDVQLEDHGNTTYTYRLWYDKDTDRAQLLDAPVEILEDTAQRDTAPDVATLERGS